jgi:hypothetical protein
MPKTRDLPGISDAAAELLSAAGYVELAHLAEAGAPRAHAELVQAHGVLGLGGDPPDLATVASWVADARRMDQTVAPEVLPVGELPLAMPLSGRVWRDRGIGIAAVPLGILAAASEPASAAPARRVVGPSAGVRRTPVDPAKVRSVSDLKSPEQLAREELEARRTPANLLKTTREETNEGIDPQSRRFVRGVLHPHRFRLFLGALVTLLAMGLVPLAVAAVILLMVADATAGGIGWVEDWFLVFPAALPVVGVLYFFLAAGLRCRVCGQRLFVPKNCRKNNKAHHAKGLGYILPLSLHLLVFRWFRCTFCGTSVRLKE